MIDSLKLVGDFHEAFEVYEPGHIDDADTNSLRISLLQEELDELRSALGENDKVAVLDALSDLQYVLDGAYHCFGLAKYKSEAFKEVHRANMSKLKEGRPVYRIDGKILKGPDYIPPALAEIMSEVDGKDGKDGKI